MLFENSQESSEVPFMTPEMIKAKERRSANPYLLEEGRDPNPIWDTVCRSIWPATREKQTHREAMSDRLMNALYCKTDDEVLDRDAAIIMARLAQLLMGKPWMERWVWDHSHRAALRQRRTHGTGIVGFIQKLLS